MLSLKAKHLFIAGQILRCAQNDSGAYVGSTSIGPEIVSGFSPRSCLRQEDAGGPTPCRRRLNIRSTLPAAPTRVGRRGGRRLRPQNLLKP
jgi:hypothetical protein